MKFSLLIVLFGFLLFFGKAHGQNAVQLNVVVGAEQSGQYLPLLKGKNVGLIVNQTSMVGQKHLIDFLIEKGVKVKAIFAAEHGVRGDAAPGEELHDGVDQKTGLPVISLYGKEKKPSPTQLKGIDVMVFDMQDVGCRFFTYISTMHYAMEACAENGVKFIVLDRPNPNGDYVAGPVLKPNCTSFIGVDPVPVVHGCTVGELAQMINTEGWLKGNVKANLTVIPVKGYTHKTRYPLPVKPSPNLPNDRAVRLYPSLCLFEATYVSVGRGTSFPFQVIGYPDSLMGHFSFVPKTIKGIAVSPIQEGKVCYGTDLRAFDPIPVFTLRFFIETFKKIGNPSLFWKSKRWIELLMGNQNFYDQINNGLTEEEIVRTWQPDLQKYLAVRKKYLLYPDF